MKNPHGQIQDASTLKGYCDKHVTPEWRKEHNSDRATVEAKAYYQREMKGRRWADSQQAALTLPDPSQAGYVDPSEDQEIEDPLTATANNKKRKAAMKKIWRMPSGAPIVPNIVFHNVENLLARWQLRKRKEFVAEACKYWTLKREARRGASLLKRLQLQLDTFTSMEITRRDFAAMGAIGRPKLQQRIEFAERLETDLKAISTMCQTIVEREMIKLRDVDTLRDIVDTVYFPVNPLLWQIFDRVLTLDSNYNYFKKGLDTVRAKLEKRFYTTVASFTSDLGQAFNLVVYSPDAEPVGIPGGEVNAPMHKLKAGEKDKKARAKRILKTIQTDLLKAAENEADLEGKSHEEGTRVVQAILETALQPPPDVHGSISDGMQENIDDAPTDQVIEGVEKPGLSEDVEMIDTGDAGLSAKDQPSTTLEVPVINGNGAHETTIAETGVEDVASSAAQQETINMRVTPGLPALSNSGSTNPSTTCHDPLTPPHGDKDIVPVVASGGVPWYLELFEPDGTTIYDERWSGRDALRGISEELSELDDDAVNGLLDSENGKADDEPVTVQDKLTVPPVVPKKKARPKRKNW